MLMGFKAAQCVIENPKPAIERYDHLNQFDNLRIID